MRHWITIICLVALLLYVGWVLDHHQRQVDAPAGTDISALGEAMARAGGRLQRVTFRLVAPIADPAVPGRVTEGLDRTGPARSGESREARLHTEDGTYYLALTWTMTGETAGRWIENHAALRRVLGEAGIAAPVHVELEGIGSGPGQDLLSLAHAALDGVQARDRQPWTGDRSASVAGRSARLPAGPHQVNVQAAVRETGQGVRLWVGWPALTGDY